MSETTKQALLWLIPLAPLASALLTALVGPKLLRGRSHIPCCAALAVAFACSLTLLLQPAGEHASHAELVAPGYQWISVGTINVQIELHADAMTMIMLSMVTGVSLLVAIFGSSYMHDDPGYPRFFAAVSLFVFSMCMLVLAGNFLMLFMFWEAVGLCSYLLIGFWFEKPSAAAAAKKAFVVNRIGDFGLLMGMFLIWQTFGSLNFAEVFDAQRLSLVLDAHPGRITIICLLLFLGAVGKSAQFPLMVWLPDAMEGPTPVSALIHAATMVTAGVYLVARCTPLFELAPQAQLVVAGIGAATALIAAITALTQMDLKRVLAYSTVSQLGFMFMALGAGAGAHESATVAVTAGMFHLFTHAFFKALLFLGAGSVMHSMGNVIDMRHFSGLRKAWPITHTPVFRGAAALAGLPNYAGFWSKDDILAVLSTAAGHEEYGAFFKVIYGLACATALLTAFYTFRACFMTFWGEEKFPEEAGHHPHDAPPVMAIPLGILAICSIGIGFALGPTHLFAGKMQQAIGLEHVESHGVHWDIMAISAGIALAGILGAWFCYVQAKAIPRTAAAGLKPLYQLSYNKLYLDEIFSAILVMPLHALAKLATLFDALVIDPIVDGVGRLPRLFSAVPRRLHNGLVPAYGIVMWAGLVIGVLAMLGILQR